jgi:hypothetical protein
MNWRRARRGSALAAVVAVAVWLVTPWVAWSLRVRRDTRHRRQ